MRAISTITFVYEPHEDRIAAAINAGRPDAWSCWLTRRLTLALLNRTPNYLTTTSKVAQRVPTELRREAVAFERDAAMAQTAQAMKQTPLEVLKTSSNANKHELAERLTITAQGEKSLLELQGKSGEIAKGLLTRAELQRILQMLQDVAVKADWLPRVSDPAPLQEVSMAGMKSARH